MAIRNAKTTLLRADAMPHMIRKLHGSIYFEKSLTAIAAASHSEKTSATLTVPSSFVQDHGDKFRKSVLLRTESSTNSWPVNLQVWFNSPSSTQVKFGGGWGAFATCNGLLEGDWLIFVLTAISEFQVYIFRSVERVSPNPSSPKNRTPTRRKEAKNVLTDAEIHGCGDHKRLGTDEEGSEEGSNDCMIANRESGVVQDSALYSGNSPSCRIQDNLHDLPLFTKTLKECNVRKRAAYLELPGQFCRTQGSRIHSVVQLQGIHEDSPVQTVACVTNFGRDIRHYLRADWQSFVAENHLRVGQQLLFILSAESFFVVRDRSPRNRASSNRDRFVERNCMAP